MTKIVGVDLGLAKMGVVTLRIHNDNIAGQYKELFVSDAKKFSHPDARLAYMCENAQISIGSAEPEIVTCEYPFNVKGNGRVLVEMYGIIKLFCFKRAIPFVPVAQTSLKKYATGGGKAEKSDMRLQLYKEFGLDYSEDEADAYWLAHLGWSIRYASRNIKGSLDRVRKDIAEMLRKKHLN